MGSRSMRGGTSWLVFAALCTDEDEIETLMDLLESTGVERLMDGRLSAAGLMSTIVEEQSPPRVAEGRRGSPRTDAGADADADADADAGEEGKLREGTAM